MQQLRNAVLNSKASIRTPLPVYLQLQKVPTVTATSSVNQVTEQRIVSLFAMPTAEYYSDFTQTQTRESNTLTMGISNSEGDSLPLACSKKLSKKQQRELQQQQTQLVIFNNRENIHIVLQSLLSNSPHQQQPHNKLTKSCCLVLS
jgi:hypothetical protein